MGKLDATKARDCRGHPRKPTSAYLGIRRLSGQQRLDHRRWLGQSRAFRRWILCPSASTADPSRGGTSPHVT